MIKKIYLLGLILCLTLSIISGCNKPSKEISDKTVLNVSYSMSGWGDDWFVLLKNEFEKEHKGVTVQLTSEPDITGKIGMRFESGENLPDVAFLFETNYRQWAAQGFLADLTDLYEGDNYDKTFKFKDHITSEAYTYSKYLDKNWIVPWSTGVMSIVYNAGMFESNGWEVPDTQSELQSLCKTISAKGIAPFVYSGMQVTYWDFPVRTWILQKAGLSYLDEFKNLKDAEPYKNVARESAYSEFLKIFDNKWVLENSEGLSFTEAQMEFLRGEAAMIPCGYWLENEMKQVLPEGFRMKMMKTPAIDGAKNANISYVMIGDMILVPAKSKNIELSKEFIKFSSSNKMLQQAAVLAGGFRPFKYSLDNVNITEFTKSVYDIMQNNINVSFTNDNVLYSMVGFYPGYSRLGAISIGAETPQEAAKHDYDSAIERIQDSKQQLGIK